MTKNEAKKFAIAKWEYISNNNGSDKGLIDNIPILKNFLSHCSYCELVKLDCDECPLTKKNRLNCYDGKSVFGRWNDAFFGNDINKMKYWSKRMLNLVKRL